MRASFSLLFSVLIVGGLVLGFYSSLANSNDDIDSQWRNVQTAVISRADLAKKLAKVLEKNKFPKKELIKELQENSNKVAGAETKQVIRMENFQLENSIDSVFLVIDDYPKIKENVDYINVAKDLVEAERNIDVVRKEYNDAVQSHNFRVKFYPFALFSEALGLREKEYFRGVERSKFIPKEIYEKKKE